VRTRSLVLRQLVCGLMITVVSSSAATPSVQATPAQAPRVGTVAIIAALVDREMHVRPVPLHPLVLVGADSATFFARTNVDGRVSQSLPPGDYTLSSAAPVLFEGRQFRWRMSLTVTAGATTSLALTNDNAIREQAPQPIAALLSADCAESEVALVDRLKNSIFRIEAGFGHGAAFVADTLGGVVLANAHVVEGVDPGDLSVLLDPRTRVRAQLLAWDPDADIAVLRVHSRHLPGRVRIPLQKPMGRAPVAPGERIVAMGCRLPEGPTHASGHASGMFGDVVLSDVVITPENSGGPLLNACGEAIAINAFRDPAEGSTRVSGSVLVPRAGPVLALAAAELQKAQPISDGLLPIMPTERMSDAALQAYADTTDAREYHPFSDIGLESFTLTVQTPAQVFVTRYSGSREYHDWTEYVGEPTTPVVAISAVARKRDRRGEAPGFPGPEFEGDVRGVQVFRNGDFVEPIKGGCVRMKVHEGGSWVPKFLPKTGLYLGQGFCVYDPELLRPDSSGVAPSIVVVVQDRKSTPGEFKCRELPAEVVARAWNDFEGFYREARPNMRFWRADLKASKAHGPSRAISGLRGECTWNRR
jgi:hypothetical protein